MKFVLDIEEQSINFALSLFFSQAWEAIIFWIQMKLLKRLPL